MYGYHPRRNQPVTVEAVNPKAETSQVLDTGNAGLDGYTVLSRAHQAGVRPMIGGTPAPQGPRYQEEQ